MSFHATERHRPPVTRRVRLDGPRYLRRVCALDGARTCHATSPDPVRPILRLGVGGVVEGVGGVVEGVAHVFVVAWAGRWLLSLPDGRSLAVDSLDHAEVALAAWRGHRPSQRVWELICQAEAALSVRHLPKACARGLDAAQALWSCVCAPTPTCGEGVRCG